MNAKKIIVGIMLLIPLILSISMLIYLKISWQVITPAGEKLSPISNTPLFVGLIIFCMGYVVFLLMLFSEDIMSGIKQKKLHK